MAASVNSFLPFAPFCFCETAPAETVSARTLAHSQNFIHPNFKVFLTFGPHFITFERHGCSRACVGDIRGDAPARTSRLEIALLLRAQPEISGRDCCRAFRRVP